MSATLNLQRFEELGRKLGQEIGSKIADRLQRYSATAPNREPVKFKDGTPLASDLTTAEAEALGKNLHLVGAYVNDIDNQRYFGVTLEAFAENQIYNGPADESMDVTADLWNAIQKQSAAFSAHYMNGK